MHSSTTNQIHGVLDNQDHYSDRYLQLIERGQMKLDAPLTTYLLRITVAYGDHVTIRMLLNHTSGIPNPIPSIGSSRRQIK
jgi:CubicO group peptidase (beta-lactamase class C family)